MASSYSLMTRIDDSTSEFADGKDRPRDWNRFMGGRRRTNHPYISGYWYFFLEPPKFIFKADSVLATNWWFTTAEGFTPHSSTLLKVDVPGMGGQASSYAAGREINRTFSVTFREYQNLPILNFFSMWSAAINDPHLGLSMMAGYEYIPANYKGCAYVALCKPSHKDHTGSSPLKEEDIEVLWYYDGVFPENIPSDTFASDISGNDTAQLSLNFSFDGYPVDGKNEDMVLDHFIGKVQSSYINKANNLTDLFSLITKDVEAGNDAMNYNGTQSTSGGVGTT